MENVYEPLKNLAPTIKVRPALCLDFDGTIRKSKTGTFIKDENDIELIEFVERKIFEYKENGYLIIGISNQGGVAYGHKRPSHIERELLATLQLFRSNPFDIVKQCYHMEGGSVEPYNYRSLLRKPNIGMLALAEVEAWYRGFMIDWDKSLFVGDRPEDEQCARNANILFMHIDGFLTYQHTFI